MADEKTPLDHARQFLRVLTNSRFNISHPESTVTRDELEGKIAEQEATVARLQAEWDEAEAARLAALDAQRLRFEADHAAADAVSN